VTKTHIFRKANTAAAVGIVLVCAGAYLLHDAYDARGRSKPFLMKFVPGA
jgi:hypothetical protein